MKPVVLLVLAALIAFSALPARAAADASETAKRVVEKANAFRKAQGLQAQAVNPALEKAAPEFARFIVRENIAYLYRSTGYDSATLAREFVEGWKKSPGHRKNMLAPAATQTGVGVAQGEDGRYYGVQMLGRPKSAAIRFSVRNRAGEKIDYRAGERKFSLPPRAVVDRKGGLAVAHE